MFFIMQYLISRLLAVKVYVTNEVLYSDNPHNTQHSTRGASLLSPHRWRPNRDRYARRQQ